MSILFYILNLFNLRRSASFCSFCASHVSLLFPTFEQFSPVTNLDGEDVGSTSEVYVILEVEQDNWTIDKTFCEFTSQVVEDLNPVFNEDYECLLPNLKNMVLKVGVWAWDTGFDDEMGDAEIKLDDLHPTATPKQVQVIVDHHMWGDNAVAYFNITWKTV